jgi:hypothetical protein
MKNQTKDTLCLSVNTIDDIGDVIMSELPNIKLTKHLITS